jgi:hypothetical protein
MQTMTDWLNRKPALFKKQPYYLPGCDKSGVPGDPHDDDLAPIRAKGDYVPMLFGAAAVDAATRERIGLRPA